LGQHSALTFLAHPWVIFEWPIQSGLKPFASFNGRPFGLMATDSLLKCQSCKLWPCFPLISGHFSVRNLITNAEMFGLQLINMQP